MRICKADFGNTSTFTCSYHGWVYGDDGALLTAPFIEEYDAVQQLRDWRAVTARVDSYKGLVFATFDPTAPSLVDYLGDMAYYLDALVDRREGGTVAVGGVHKTVVHANWKYGAENFVQDGHHALVTHASAIMAMTDPDVLANLDQLPGVMLYTVDGGHGGVCFTDSSTLESGGIDAAVTRYMTDHVLPESEQRLGPARNRLHNVAANTLFPNLSWLTTLNTLRIWLPRGPHAMELWSWVLVDAAASDEEKETVRRNVVRTFTPGGIFEQDDTENWNLCQDTLRGHVARQQWHNMQMGLGKEGSDVDYPGTISYGMGELPGRNFYKRWLEMIADSGPGVWHTGPAPRAGGTVTHG
jgi:phenylpropionate dioxygenase-like ring-hydroxylating dioxygenase large terminal subunit